MKKLIIILLFIPLVFSCSSVSKKELNPFSPDDKWVRFGQQFYDFTYSESKVDWNDLTGEFYYEFTEDNKVISNYFRSEEEVHQSAQNQWLIKENLAIEENLISPEEKDQINNTKDTITFHNYFRGKIEGISFYKPIFYSNDTLVLVNYNPLCMGPIDCREKERNRAIASSTSKQKESFKNFVINNYEDWIMDNTSTPDSIGAYQKLFLKLHPKYQPDEAREILRSTKIDLDLEFITQKQFDSVKKIMTRYINWKK